MLYEKNGTVQLIGVCGDNYNVFPLGWVKLSI
jgi:hypothetical protein